MKIERTFIISCKTFGGFCYTIDVNEFEKTEDIINTFIQSIEPSIIKTIDYVSIVDQATFTPTNGSINTDALMLVAVRFGSTRLIDNIELTL